MASHSSKTLDALYQDLSSPRCNPLPRWELRVAFREVDRIQDTILHRLSVWLPNLFNDVLSHLAQQVVIHRRRKSLLRKGPRVVYAERSSMGGRKANPEQSQFVALCIRLLGIPPEQRTRQDVKQLSVVRDIWDPLFEYLRWVSSEYLSWWAALDQTPDDLALAKKIKQYEEEFGVGRELYGMMRWFHSKLEALKRSIDVILMSHLRLVNSIAREYPSAQLVQNFLSGIQGLRRAAMLFDVEQSPVFHSYALSWVKQSIVGSFVSNIKLYTVPQRYVRISKAYEELVEEGITPTATMLGVTDYEVAEALQAARNPLSLDWVISTDGSQSSRLEELISAPEDEDTYGELRQLLGLIPEDQHKIVALKMGALGLLPGSTVPQDLIDQEMSRQYEESLLL